MNYSESNEQCYEYFRMSLSGLIECRVPVNPVNYAVWYEYVSGKNNALNAVMEKLFKQPVRIDNTIHKKLYNRFVAEDDKQVTLEVVKTITELLASLDRSTGEEMTLQEEAITDYTAQLMEVDEPEEVGEIVDCLLSKTRMMMETGRTLKERVNASCRELDELKEEIDRFKLASVTDPLSGLLNRRGCEDAFDKEVKNGGEGGSASLIMMDIDHFKRINDSFGHLVGDNVIKVIACIIRKYLKGRAIASRFGGEEFIVCLPGAKMADARKFAEKIRKTVEAVVWKRKESGASLGTITISMGVAEYRSGEPLEVLVQRADKALYRSKEGGRNRVSTEMDMG